MAELTVETKFGTVTLRDAMIDTDGTNLADGVEVKVNDELIDELIGVHFDDEMTPEEVEEFIEDHCDTKYL